jgi:hypothetical protein
MNGTARDDTKVKELTDNSFLSCDTFSGHQNILSEVCIAFYV